MEEQQEYEEEDASSEVANLSGALSNLMELDFGVLSKKRKARLARMKRQIFDSLVYYCECLPQLQEDDEDKKD